MNKTVKVLLDRAAKTNIPDDALKISQAALNAVNAIFKEKEKHQWEE